MVDAAHAASSESQSEECSGWKGPRRRPVHRGDRVSIPAVAAAAAAFAARHRDGHALGAVKARSPTEARHLGHTSDGRKAARSRRRGLRPLHGDELDGRRAAASAIAIDAAAAALPNAPLAAARAALARRPPSAASAADRCASANWSTMALVASRTARRVAASKRVRRRRRDLHLRERVLQRHA